jgi:hypothetical protein
MGKKSPGISRRRLSGKPIPENPKRLFSRKWGKIEGKKGLSFEGMWKQKAAWDFWAKSFVSVKS